MFQPCEKTHAVVHNKCLAISILNQMPPFHKMKIGFKTIFHLFNCLFYNHFLNVCYRPDTEPELNNLSRGT